MPEMDSPKQPDRTQTDLREEGNLPEGSQPSGEGTFIQSTNTSEPTKPSSQTKFVSEQVPGYEIQDVLGRGGMGIVYRARQIQANRIVALKMVLTAGYASEIEKTRFRAEAEAAARLSHPNIVQVYEVGEYNGIPYFSLEYCDRGTLSDRLDGTPFLPKEAARLVEYLARAMQTAHQSGIIHRDLKPSNILLRAEFSSGSGFGMSSQLASRSQSKIDITGEDPVAINVETTLPKGSIPGSQTQWELVPKIADFGLAKKLDDDSGLTRPGDVMGTPSYMAPEQARGHLEEIGAASDVYSLGAILYELLTGRPPFKAATAQETIEMVKNREPVALHILNPKTPRDLETITLKCLQKEVNKRYQSATELADDLRRFIDGQPIVARPITPFERMMKWVQRNPVVAALSIAMVVITVLGVALVTWKWQQAEDRAEAESIARQRADTLAEEMKILAQKQEQLAKLEKAASQAASEQALRANKVTEFLADLFRTSDPIDFLSSQIVTNWEKEKNLTARELLDRGRERIDKELRDQPIARAAILDTIGNTYRNLGLFKEAKSLLEEAFSIRQKLLHDNHPEQLLSLFHLGWLYQDLGDYDQAIRFYSRAMELESQIQSDPRLRWNIRAHLAMTKTLRMDEDAEPLYRQIIEEANKAFGPDDHATLFSKAGLIGFYLDQGRGDQIWPLLFDVLQTLQKQEDQRIKTLANALVSFQAGVGMQFQGFYGTAEPILQNALKTALSVLPPDNMYVLLIRYHLARGYEKQQKPKEAEKEYRWMLDGALRTTGIAHPKVVLGLDSYANFLGAQKRIEEGRKLYQMLREANRKQFEASNPWYVYIRICEATFEFDFGNDSLGYECCKEIIDLLDRGQYLLNRTLCVSLDELIFSMPWGAKNVYPEQLSRRLQPLMEKMFGSNSKEYGMTQIGLARILSHYDHFADAEKLILAIEKSKIPLQEVPEANRRWIAYEMGRIDRSRGHLLEAEKRFRVAYDQFKRGRSEWPSEFEDAGIALGGILCEIGKSTEAIPILEEVIRSALRRKINPEDLSWRYWSLALAQLSGNQIDGYRKTLDSVLQQVKQSKKREGLVNLLRIWLIGAIHSISIDMKDLEAIKTLFVEAVREKKIGRKWLPWIHRYLTIELPKEFKTSIDSSPLERVIQTLFQAQQSIDSNKNELAQRQLLEAKTHWEINRPKANTFSWSGQQWQYRFETQLLIQGIEKQLQGLKSNP